MLQQLVLACKAALEKGEGQIGSVILRGLVQDQSVSKPSKNPVDYLQLVRRECAYHKIDVGHLGARSIRDGPILRLREMAANSLSK